MASKYIFSGIFALAIFAAVFISGCAKESTIQDSDSDYEYSGEYLGCAPEGEVMVYGKNFRDCCEGLALIDPMSPKDLAGGICTAKCGNGVCDELETYTNCGADCDLPTPTCEEIGGECMRPEQKECGGIHFKAYREVSDCPGRCCACCKQIIPECVPAQCCHPTSCVLVQWGPDCDDVECSEECRPGTMDCGCGSCKLDRSRAECNVVWSEKEGCSGGG